MFCLSAEFPEARGRPLPWELCGCRALTKLERLRCLHRLCDLSWAIRIILTNCLLPMWSWSIKYYGGIGKCYDEKSRCFLFCLMILCWSSSGEAVTVWLVHTSDMTSPPATIALARSVAFRFVPSWGLNQVNIRFWEWKEVPSWGHHVCQVLEQPEHL